MRSIDIPENDIREVYEKCVEGVYLEDFTLRLTTIKNNIVIESESYNEKAQNAEWFNIDNDEDVANEDILIGEVTKKELKNLYTQYMIGKGKPARSIYDHLLGRAPFGKCPYCGYGHARTLDHYLPKNGYPKFSVLPYNLVPSCRDCNTLKSTTSASTAENQTLHPYYDHVELTSEQWLYATIQDASLSIEYYVSAPNNWTELSKQRVIAHFKEYDLEKRFPLEAADELATLNGQYTDDLYLTDSEAVKRDLFSRAEGAYRANKNSWRTAMYQALGESDWFCNEGVLLL